MSILLDAVQEFRIGLNIPANAPPKNDRPRPKTRSTGSTLVVKDEGKPVLNDGQQLFVDGLCKWFSDRDSKSYSILDGAAGTGKSFGLVQALAMLGLSPRQVKLCAPMVTAARNVASILSGYGLEGYETTTAHKLFRMRFDYESGQWFSLGLYLQEWKGVRLLIVDEAYTLGDDITQVLLQSTPQYVKVLFVGDSYQLPPVISDKAKKQAIDNINELPDPFRLSPIVGMDAELFRLQKVMRQDGGNTLLLGESIRGAIDFADKIMPQIWRENKARKKGCSVSKMAEKIGYDDTLRQAQSIEELEAGLIEAFKAGKKAKFLAWTNKVVDRANDKCFKALFPEAPHQFVVGAFVQLQEHWRNGTNELIVPSTSEGYVISESFTTRWILGKEIPCHQLVIDFGNDIGMMPMVVPTVEGKAAIAAIKKTVRHRSSKAAKIDPEMTWSQLREDLELDDMPNSEASVLSFMGLSYSSSESEIPEMIHALLEIKKIRIGGDVASLVSDMFSALAELGNGYASTVHKAQGATYDRTFFFNDLIEFFLGEVEEKDGELFRRFSGCDPRMALRLIYVAMSRHREFVMFLDS